jgi:hypothetical protein
LAGLVAGVEGDEVGGDGGGGGEDGVWRGLEGCGDGVGVGREGPVESMSSGMPVHIRHRPMMDSSCRRMLSLIKCGKAEQTGTFFSRAITVEDVSR